MILVAVVAGYFVIPQFLPSSPVPASTLQASPAPTSGVTLSGSNIEGREFARVLVSLQNIKLSDRIFSDPLYKSLVDFSGKLEPQAKGRKNPFAPLGTDAGAPASFTDAISTSTETTTP